MKAALWNSGFEANSQALQSMIKTDRKIIEGNVIYIWNYKFEKNEKSPDIPNMKCSE